MLDTPYSASFLLPMERIWNDTSNQIRLQWILQLIIDHARLQKEYQDNQQAVSSHQGLTQSNGDVWLPCIQIVGRPTSNMQCTKRKDNAQRVSGSESETSPVYGILDKAEQFQQYGITCAGAWLKDWRKRYFILKGNKLYFCKSVDVDLSFRYEVLGGSSRRDRPFQVPDHLIRG